MRKEILDTPFSTPEEQDFISKKDFSLEEIQTYFEPIMRNGFNKFFEHFEK